MAETIECRICYFDNGEPGGPLAQGPQRKILSAPKSKINVSRHNEPTRTVLGLIYELECGHQVAL